MEELSEWKIFSPTNRHAFVCSNDNHDLAHFVWICDVDEGGLKLARLVKVQIS